jgi:hypothetical protein
MVMRPDPRTIKNQANQAIGQCIVVLMPTKKDIKAKLARGTLHAHNDPAIWTAL